MISIKPFRRVRWDAEGVTTPGCVTLDASQAIACHKGDAGQSQSSTQIGAQGQGVANQGSGNVSNTGTTVVGQGAVVLNTTSPAPQTAGNRPGGNSAHQINSQGNKNNQSQTSGGSPTPSINTGTALTSTSSLTGNGNTITVTDQGAVQTALNALQTALTGAQGNLTTALNATSSTATQTQIQTAGDQAAAASPVAVVKAALQGMPTWQLVGGGVVVVALVGFGVFKLFRPKTKTS